MIREHGRFLPSCRSTRDGAALSPKLDPIANVVEANDLFVDVVALADDTEVLHRKARPASGARWIEDLNSAEARARCLYRLQTRRIGLPGRSYVGTPFSKLQSEIVKVDSTGFRRGAHIIPSALFL